MVLHQGQSEKRPFESHVLEIAVRVRTVFAELAASTGIDVSQPRSAARQLEIDNTLAWRISKIATNIDPVEAMLKLPGAASQRTMLKAFARAGAPTELVDRTRLVLDDFDAMVKQHADDRGTFEMMLSSVAREGSQAREEALRKLAFQGNSAIWGVHCRVRTWSYVITPSDHPDLGNLAAFGSFVDVRRLRSDMRLTLASVAALESDGRPAKGNPILPLIPGQAEFQGIPTLPQFCRGAVPAIERVIRPDGVTRYQVVGGDVGNNGVFTWSFGWRHPKVVPRWATKEDPTGEFALNVLIPSETAMLDVFVHKDFWPRIDPEIGIYSLLPGEAVVAHQGTPRQRVPAEQSFDRLHENPLDTSTHEVPHYSAMAESAFAVMGHKPSEFRGLRVRMKYPILSTAINLHMNLPSKPPS